MDGKTISRVFHIALSTVYRWVERDEKTGNVNSRESNSGRKPELDEKELEAIKGLVEKRPDITIEEIIEELRLPLHKSEVSNILRNRFNFRYKKKQCRQANRKDRTLKKSGKTGKRNSLPCPLDPWYSLMRVVPI